MRIKGTGQIILNGKKTFLFVSVFDSSTFVVTCYDRILRSKMLRV